MLAEYGLSDSESVKIWGMLEKNMIIDEGETACAPYTNSLHGMIHWEAFQATGTPDCATGSGRCQPYASVAAEG